MTLSTDLLKKRVPSLDVLRFVAVVMVMTFHTVPFPVELPHDMLFYFVRFGQNGGFAGVDLFFVLSGYLIGGLLFDEERRHNRIRVGRFLVRRAFKIYPPFWVFLITTVILRVSSRVGVPRRSLLGEIFFLQNYVGGLCGHTWSLAVEEHFYLGLPLLLWILLRIRRESQDPFRIIPYLTLTLILVCLVLRVVTSVLVPFEHLTHVAPTHLRIDSLLIGVMLAYFQHYHGERLLAFIRKRRVALLVFGILGFLPAFWYSRWWLVAFGALVYAASAAALILGLSVRERIPGFLERTAAFFGARSYSVYLWHMTIADMTKHLWNVRGAAGGASWWFLYAAAYIVASLLFGSLMAAIVEIPVLRLRDALVASVADPLQAGEVAAGAIVNGETGPVS